jgi:hypothetical protein
LHATLWALCLKLHARLDIVNALKALTGYLSSEDRVRHILFLGKQKPSSCHR